jgi:hypothetical protein
MFAIGHPLVRAAADDTPSSPPPTASQPASPPPAPPAPPPTAAYVDRPIVTTTSTTHYSPPSYHSNYYGDSYGRWSSNWGGFGPGSISSYTTTTFVRRRIYFPPGVPALGQPLPTKSTAPLHNLPTTNLQNYVAEPFFPPLSALVHEEGLSKKRQQRIDEYRAAKLAVVTELRNKLTALKTAEPSVRQQALSELASSQNARIRELETTAEEIREDMVQGGFFRPGVDWNESRDWRLGDDTRYESYQDEYKVARGAAYFQRGLSLEQRRLLREIAIELREFAADPISAISLDTPGPYFYFSPHAARIRLPADLSANVTAKLERYREMKDSLKKELRDTLYKEDRRWLDSRRAASLTQLAEQQTPRFADLEVLAEEIRRDLQGYRYPDEPKQSVLPDDLAQRISVYLDKKVELQRDLTSKLAEVRKELVTDRVEFVREGDGFAIQIVPSRSRSLERKRESIRASLASFNRESVARYATMAREKEVLRAEVMKISEASPKANAHKSVDQLLSEFSRSFAAQEAWNRYREYRIAVLEPGLSPEQRRLLFDAAVEDLTSHLSATSI